jgi:uncharacterized protein
MRSSSPGAATLVPVPRVNRVDIGLLRGIDQARETLLANTERFAQNFAANNALLWGARGMGKSALIKAVHATINAQLAAFPDSKPLKLVEIHREDIEGLPRLMALLRGQSWRFLVFCDDLSFDAADSSYKSLKAALEGGIEGRPGDEHLRATVDAIRVAACGWFTTMLGPGSDAAHGDHMHVDILQHGSSDRYRICQ